MSIEESQQSSAELTDIYPDINNQGDLAKEYSDIFEEIPVEDDKVFIEKNPLRAEVYSTRNFVTKAGVISATDQKGIVWKIGKKDIAILKEIVNYAYKEQDIYAQHPEKMKKNYKETTYKDNTVILEYLPFSKEFIIPMLQKLEDVHKYGSVE